VVEAKLEEIFLNHALIGGAGVTVQRDAQPPEEPVLGGWVGIYRETISMPPRALGGFRRQSIGMLLILQAAHPASGADCAEALDDLLLKVLGAITDDPTIGGTAAMLGDDFPVEYKLYNKSDQAFVQEAIVRFTAVINPS
jgi:hypothetical protein